jgi:hypothetical protein
VYQTNPNALPDDRFEQGGFHHLVAGNIGRLLDPRRTPVSIIGLRRETGTFAVRIDDFEDQGAVWEIPFEMCHTTSSVHQRPAPARATSLSIRPSRRPSTGH